MGRGGESTWERSFARCDEAFARYLDSDHSELFSFDMVTPIYDTWEQGDRTIHCVIKERDGWGWVGSAKDIGR